MTAKGVQSTERIGIAQAGVGIGGRSHAALDWLHAFKNHAANAKLLLKPAVFYPWIQPVNPEVAAPSML